MYVPPVGSYSCLCHQFYRGDEEEGEADAISQLQLCGIDMFRTLVLHSGFIATMEKLDNGQWPHLVTSLVQLLLSNAAKPGMAIINSACSVSITVGIDDLIDSLID